MEINIIHNTDCRKGLKILPDNSVNCCVTSPPYYGLRNYIGFELNTEYIEMANRKLNRELGIFK